MYVNIVNGSYKIEQAHTVIAKDQKQRIGQSFDKKRFCLKKLQI